MYVRTAKINSNIIENIIPMYVCFESAHLYTYICIYVYIYVHKYKYGDEVYL